MVFAMRKQITLTAEQLRKLQLIELEMLIEVDRICRLLDIKYNIIGGTLLGAVRHGGFIPWDDDADLAMLREDYEKFTAACKRELDNNRFYFQDASNTPGYRWGYGKLRRKGTIFLRENQEHMPYEQGVFIDIFPLDAVPDSYGKRKIMDIYCFCLRKILWSAVGRFSDKNLFVRMLYKLLYHIPFRWIYKNLKWLISQCAQINSAEVRILLMPSPSRECCYHRHWFESTKRLLFEGVELSGMDDYDGFLKWEFGDYMKMPPEEKRKVHPVTALQLVEPVLPKGVAL